MRIMLILVLFCFCVVFAFSEDFLDVQVVRVYDGDTFFVDIPDVPAVFGDDIGVRVRGVDTPEIRGKCDSEKRLAYASRDFVIGVLEGAQRVDLLNVERGKYFRIVASVVVDGVALDGLLIDEGLAVVYDGGKKPLWCN